MSSKFGPSLGLARFELQGDPALPQSESRAADACSEPLLTALQFAERLGVSERSVHRRIADKTIRTLKLGRLVRIHPSELARLLDRPADGGAEKYTEDKE